MTLFIIFTLILISYEVNCVSNRIDPLVLTNQGLIRGQSATDGDYSTFLGIPYGRIDYDNPFGENLPPENFTEVFDADNNNSICPQLVPTDGVEAYQGNLDCLTLNIYVPSVATSRNLLPVLVYIHGGYYRMGSANSVHGREFVRHDIVFVAINYRLSAYGFMCLDIPSVPGNQALNDQLTALRWIKNNIDVFGGNPDDITISGQSAGAISVDFHIFSPHEKLYNKVILQSGSAESYSLMNEGDESAAVKLSTHLGFPTDDTEQALSFLNTVNPRLVLGAVNDLSLELYACKERSFSGYTNFVDSDPYSFEARGKVRNMPVMLGYVTREWLMYTPTYYDNAQNIFRTYIVHDYNLEEEDIIEASNLLRDFYFGDRTMLNDIVDGLEQFLSDIFMNHPIHGALKRFVEQGASPIYNYVFSYSGLNQEAVATHGEELKFLFPLYSSTNYTKEDIRMIDTVTTLWANFVKYGNPTPQPFNKEQIIWQPVTQNTRPYLLIDSDLSLANSSYKERMAFWDLFFLKYGKYHKLVTQCTED